MKKILFILFILPLFSIAQDDENKTPHEEISTYEYSEWFRLGTQSLDSLNYGDAISYFSMAIYLEPEQPAPYAYRGDAFQQEEEYLKAIEDYTRLIKLMPDEDIGYLGRAIVYSTLGNHNSAINDLSKAIEKFPNDEGLYVVRGGNYADINEFDKACADYNYALKLGNTDSYVIDFVKNNCN